MTETYFLVTGKLVNGKRFKPIKTWNYYYAIGINLFSGSVWKIEDGKRTLIKRVRANFN